MSLIYEPKGKAREYSPLALNIYSGGCGHACTYCYCASMSKAFGRKWEREVTPRNLDGLRAEARKACHQVLLCFVGDPYSLAELTHRRTRAALEILREERCSVAILTKGGVRCLDDMDLFMNWPDGRIKVGATLTFLDPEKSREYEPGAGLPESRLSALEFLHRNGIKTWASIEPVIDPVESLAVISKSLAFVDAYKVGKLNHQESKTDWTAFCDAAVEMIRGAGKTLYVKNDLRPFASIKLTAAESNPETVFLPDRV